MEVEDQVIDQSPVEVVDTAPVEAVDTEIEQPVPQEKTRGERVNALRGRAKDQYRLNGNLEAAERYQAKNSQPAALEAETEPAPGPGRTEQPQPRTKNERNFRSLSEKAANLERDLIATKAKLEVYERERAGSGPSAPATPKEQPKVADKDARPTFPNIRNFDNVEDFDKAVENWQKQDADWLQRQLDTRFSGEQQRQLTQQSTEKWTAQLNAGRKQHADFDQIALNDSTPISYASMAVIFSLEDGALRSYALGKNLELATKLAELTFIPGEHEFKTLPEFMKWVKADPERAMLYGEKVALAKAELAKLTVGKASTVAPAIPQKPLKEVIRDTKRPSVEVDTEEVSTPVRDPIAKAIQDIKNGVPGAQKVYNRLKNEQDLRDRRGR